MIGLQYGIMVQKLYNTALPEHNEIWEEQTPYTCADQSLLFLYRECFFTMQTYAHLTLLTVFLSLAFCHLNFTVHVPPEYAYLLPRPFNNTSTPPFVNTTLPAGQAKDIIATTHHASSFSYDPDFDAIISNSPTVVELASSNTSFAFEGGLWVLPLNQIWFTAFLDPIPGYLSILDLNTSAIFQPTLPGPHCPAQRQPSLKTPMA